MDTDTITARVVRRESVTLPSPTHPDCTSTVHYEVYRTDVTGAETVLIDYTMFREFVDEVSRARRILHSFNVPAKVTTELAQ